MHPRGVNQITVPQLPNQLKVLFQIIHRFVVVALQIKEHAQLETRFGLHQTTQVESIKQRDAQQQSRAIVRIYRLYVFSICI